MKTSKSPRRAMQVAFVAARKAIPAYAHRFSPKKFTQHQVFACLVLKEFLKLDYRGLMHLLKDSADLPAVIELDVVPHWTTFQKAADRLLKKTPHTGSWIKQFASPRGPASYASARN